MGNLMRSEKGGAMQWCCIRSVALEGEYGVLHFVRDVDTGESGFYSENS